MMITIDALSLELLKAFLLRESHDYRFITNSQIREEWVQYRIKEILKAINSFNGKCNRYFEIVSYNNCGSLIRSMVIVLDLGDNLEYDNKARNFVVQLCICGKNNCWGTIIIPNGKILGRRQVHPI